MDLTLDPKTTALVLIDLENGTAAMTLAPYAADQVVARCGALLTAFRAAAAPIVFVRVDMDDEPHPPTDHGRPYVPPPAFASDFVPALDVRDGDKVIVKRQYGAFWNTDLHEHLQSLGVTTIVLGGIDTNVGVETTGRDAFDRRYAVVFAEDAMSSMAAQMHQFAIDRIFPIFGRVRSVDAITAALA